jgi:ABC-type antimicrobial peptide transport system permease subunit
MEFAGSIQSIARSIDRDQPLFEMRTMDGVLSDSVAPARFRAVLFAIFGGLALSLAAIGIYGVIAYTAAQRTREVGIRMALGARRRDIFLSVVAGGMGLVVAGVLAGALGAWWVSRFLSSLLFGLSPTDISSFASTAVVLAVVSALACTAPAIRAMRVDPLRAIRSDG